MAAQLMATNGRSCLGEFLWIYCANTSLPLPVGPLTNTFTLDLETFRAKVSRSTDKRSAAIVLWPSVIKLTAKFSKNCSSSGWSVLGRDNLKRAAFIDLSTEKVFAFSSMMAKDFAPRFFTSSTTFLSPPISFSKAALKIAFTFGPAGSWEACLSKCSTVAHCAF